MSGTRPTVQATVPSMGNSGRSSFRKVLLARILLLSVPVLLLGEVVAYRKARSSLLETARQNLTESAVRKGEEIQEAIAALQSNLLTATKSTTLQSGSPEEVQQFLGQLRQWLPTKVQCIQLTDLKTGAIAANTCDPEPQIRLFQELNLPLTAESTALGHHLAPSLSKSAPVKSWPQRQAQALSRSMVHIAPEALLSQLSQPAKRGQLKLTLNAPVYDTTGQLRYALSVQTALHQSRVENDKPGSLSGDTVVIDEDGTILAHPQADQVGKNIRQEDDVARLKPILRNALRNKDSSFRYLSNFSEDEDEDARWLAGYTPITIPITADRSRTWLVLAVTPWDKALHGLEEIKQILILLTLGLVTAIFLATLYMSRDLSLPLEQLGKYALQIQRRHTGHGISSMLITTSQESQPESAVYPLVPELLPRSFKIRELNQLAEALNSMVKRLEERAEELESAWQEAETANQLKSEFLATMSHELRTPLNAIIGCVRLVRDGCCDDRTEETDFLQRADEAAIHLLNIINDLLDVAKIEAGTLSIFPESVDLKQVLEEVIDLQIVPIQQKKLELMRSDLSDELLVRADRAKLKQVLLNVLCNAVKFTDQGGIAIATRLEWVPDPQPESTDKTACAVVAIQDTGIGIDPAQQSKLFRPFVMADGTTTRRFEGTGLGLAISRNLIQLMGGNIKLYSAGAGQGTTVEVTLPLVEQPEAYPDPPPEKSILEAGYYQAVGPAAKGSEINP